jgi:geranylgeranyl pyrophosphate synthase
VRVQSAVALHLYKGEGLDPLEVSSRVNFTGLANKSRKKTGILIDYAHTRTVHTATANSPYHGPSGLRAGPSTRTILVLNR